MNDSKSSEFKPGIIKILKRPTNQKTNNEEKDLKKTEEYLSFEEREEKYRQARFRILGSMKNEESESETENDINDSDKNSHNGITKENNRRYAVKVNSDFKHNESIMIMSEADKQVENKLSLADRENIN